MSSCSFVNLINFRDTFLAGFFLRGGLMDVVCGLFAVVGVKGVGSVVDVVSGLSFVAISVVVVGSGIRWIIQFG